MQAGGNAANLLERLRGAARHFTAAMLAVDEIAERHDLCRLIARTLPGQPADPRQIQLRRERARLAHDLQLARLHADDGAGHAADRCDGPQCRGGERRAQLRALQHPDQQIGPIQAIEQSGHFAEPL